MAVSVFFLNFGDHKLLVFYKSLKMVSVLFRDLLVHIYNITGTFDNGLLIRAREL